jgi:hypothetical protein
VFDGVWRNVEALGEPTGRGVTKHTAEQRSRYIELLEGNPARAALDELHAIFTAMA